MANQYIQGFEIILFALVVLTLNVLDSVTTHLAFRQYPDKDLKAEGNPIMRWVMLKSRVLAEVFKHGGVLAFCIYLVTVNDINSLRLATLILGLAVINNTFIVVSRAITKRKVVTPFERLRRILHFPDKYTYAMTIVVLVGLALTIYVVVW